MAAPGSSQQTLRAQAWFCFSLCFFSPQMTYNKQNPQNSESVKAVLLPRHHGNFPPRKTKDDP